MKAYRLLAESPSGGTAKRKNKFVLVAFIVISLIFMFGLFLFMNPFKRIRNADYESSSFYFSIYKQTMSEKSFDKLLERLLEDNMDLKSIDFTFIYIEENKLCKFQQTLKKKRDYLASLPLDTSWTVYLTDEKSRMSSNSKPLYETGLCTRIDSFVTKCSVVSNK